MTCQTACATHSEIIVKTIVVKPPDSLLTECEKPEVRRLETNEDLIDLASIALMYLEQCSAKVDSIRLFFEETENDNEND